MGSFRSPASPDTMVRGTGKTMKRRSKAAGEPVKTRRRKPASPKRQKAARPSSITQSNTTIGHLTRERDQLLEQQTATANLLWNHQSIEIRPATGSADRGRYRCTAVPRHERGDLSSGQRGLSLRGRLQSRSAVREAAKADRSRPGHHGRPDGDEFDTSKRSTTF